MPLIPETSILSCLADHPPLNAAVNALKAQATTDEIWTDHRRCAVLDDAHNCLI